MDDKNGAHDLPAQFQGRHVFVSTRRGRNSQPGSRLGSHPVCWPEPLALSWQAGPASSFVQLLEVVLSRGHSHLSRHVPRALQSRCRGATAPRRKGRPVCSGPRQAGRMARDGDCQYWATSRLAGDEPLQWRPIR
jgi:hypothetical protein